MAQAPANTHVPAQEHAADTRPYHADLRLNLFGRQLPEVAEQYHVQVMNRQGFQWGPQTYL